MRQGCALASTRFNLYFDAVILMELGRTGVEQNKSIAVAYLHNAELVRNRQTVQLETLVTDRQYADDMALLANSWDDLQTILTSLSTYCCAFGLPISCEKTKSMAIFLSSPCVHPSIFSPINPLMSLSPFPVPGKSHSK